jgi:competence protein ComEC
MLKSGMDLSADVLKLAHHGSAYSTSEDFLKAVHPSCGVVSAGKDNDYGHPNIKVMRSMLNHHISVFRTDKQGTIIFKTDGKSILVNKEIYQITNQDIGG